MDWLTIIILVTVLLVTLIPNPKVDEKRDTTISS